MNSRRPLPPLVVHVIFRLDVGGLENGLINLINHMPAERYRHSIVCLTEATAFAKRLRKSDVEIVCLNKRAGTDWSSFWRFFCALKRLKPHIVHTRNLAGLEYLPLAACAGVSGRVHGEHGRDTYDLHGTNWKYVWLRRFVHSFISCYTVVSQDLASWLSHVVSAKPSSIYQIYNGVDTEKFSPAREGRIPIGPPEFSKPESVIIGTVGRMLPVKDQLTLVRSFVALITRASALRERLRLVVIGEGPLREQAVGILREANLESIVWLPGERQDIPELMRGMDVFVLPSIAEGISNTILEAMATGLPVVATDVGGNGELIEEGATGKLVPSQNPDAMADAIASYVASPSLRVENGQAGRKRVERYFSLDAMVEGYLKVYDSLCEKRSMAPSR